jgi:hypothetical protein
MLEGREAWLGFPLAVWMWRDKLTNKIKYLNNLPQRGRFAYFTPPSTMIFQTWCMAGERFVGVFAWEI